MVYFLEHRESNFEYYLQEFLRSIRKCVSIPFSRAPNLTLERNADIDCLLHENLSSQNIFSAHHA
jgi:hypothetical protein